MFGQFVPVQARIEKLNAMSAHADAGEIVQWLRTFPARAGHHLSRAWRAARAGRAESRAFERELGWNVRIPEYGEQVRWSFEQV